MVFIFNTHCNMVDIVRRIYIQYVYEFKIVCNIICKTKFSTIEIARYYFRFQIDANKYFFCFTIFDDLAIDLIQTLFSELNQFWLEKLLNAGNEVDHKAHVKDSQKY